MSEPEQRAAGRADPDNGSTASSDDFVLPESTAGPAGCLSPQERVNIEVSDLTIRFRPAPKFNWLKLGSRKPPADPETPAAGPQTSRGSNGSEKTLLHHISLSVPSGSIMAIIGGSGSGKTTLLNHVAGRTSSNSSLAVSGTVNFNGYPHRAALARISHAYVVQQDILLPQLTCRETLQFAAQLKLNCRASVAAEAANAVLRELGLSDCADTLVGDSEHRGLSGGEKRRLSIGVQLVADPALLFLDEPTTGLDAAAALLLVETLRKLSRQGRTIVLSIHQPRSDILALFDSVCILTRGCCVYAGSAASALDYFSGLGFRVPPLFNPADFYIEISAIDFRSRAAFIASGRRVAQLVAHWAEVSQNKPITPQSDPVVTPLPPPRARRRRGTEFITQLRTITARTLLVSRRDPLGLLGVVLQAIFLALAAGWVFFRPGPDAAGMRTIAGALYISVTLFPYLIMLLEIFRLTSTDIRVFDRERAEGDVGVVAFVFGRRLARFISEDIGMSVLFSIVAYFMLGLEASARQFFIFYAVQILCLEASLAVALLCVAISREFATAALVGNLYATLISMASGFFVVPFNMPVYVRWCRWLCYTYYGLGALLANQFDGFSGASSGEAFLLSMGARPGWLAVPIGALVALLAIVYLLAVVLLAWRKVAVGVARQVGPKAEDNDSWSLESVENLEEIVEKVGMGLGSQDEGNSGNFESSGCFAGDFGLETGSKTEKVSDMMVGAGEKQADAEKLGSSGLEESEAEKGQKIEILEFKAEGQVNNSDHPSLESTKTERRSDMEAETPPVQEPRISPKSHGNGRKLGVPAVEDEFLANTVADNVAEPIPPSDSSSDPSSATPAPAPTIELSHLSLSVRYLAPHFSPTFNLYKHKQILRDVSARFRPGTLNAIMGPSGSGKSTLMNFLCGRTKSTLAAQYIPDSATELRLGGWVISPSAAAAVCSYVAQDDDALNPLLTVRELLHYAAKLRLAAPQWTSAQRAARVDSLVAQLGLAPCQHTLVGSEFSKGLSGGEKRRLSIAVQLLSDPKVLFLDEPTSGLDAFTAASILELLNSLAAEGRTVVFTVHQPRSDVFRRFGHVLLLSPGGQSVFSGSPGELADHFAALGFRCPPLTNPADFYLDLVSYDLRSARRERESRERVAWIVAQRGREKCGWSCDGGNPVNETYKSQGRYRRTENGNSRESAEERGKIGNSGSLGKEESSGECGEDEKVQLEKAFPESCGSSIPEVPLNSSDSPASAASPATAEEIARLFGTLARRAAPARTAYATIVRRQALTFTRSPEIIVARLMQVIGMGIVLALFYAPLKSNQSGIFDAMGATQQVSALYFCGMLNNFAVYPAERDGFYQEYRDGCYGILPFFLSYATLELPFEVFSALGFSAFLSFAVGLRRDAAMFFSIAYAAFAITNCGESLGIIFNTLLSHTGFAVNVVSVCLSIGTFMGGLLSLQMDAVLRGINWISPVWYALVPLFNLAMDKRTFTCTAEELADGGCEAITGKEVLQLYGLKVSVARMLGGLIGICVAYRVLAYIVLHSKLRETTFHNGNKIPRS